MTIFWEDAEYVLIPVAEVPEGVARTQYWHRAEWATPQAIRNRIAAGDWSRTGPKSKGNTPPIATSVAVVRKRDLKAYTHNEWGEISP